MCGRFSLSIDALALKELVKAFADASMDEWRPSWNIAPSQCVPALEASHDALPCLRLRRWGASSSGRLLVNLRSEAISKERLRRRGVLRCAIPSDGFYEWRRNGKISSPYFLRGEACPLLFFAALKLPDGDGFAILTCESAPPLSSIHGRSPVLLSGNALSAWLGDLDSAFLISDTLSQSAKIKLSMRRVDPRVNSVAFNSPEAHAQFDAPEQGELF